MFNFTLLFSFFCFLFALSYWQHSFSFLSCQARSQKNIRLLFSSLLYNADKLKEETRKRKLKVEINVFDNNERFRVHTNCLHFQERTKIAAKKHFIFCSTFFKLTFHFKYKWHWRKMQLGEIFNSINSIFFLFVNSPLCFKKIVAFN